MKIADLHSFVTVADAGSFNGAAERLFRTSAAIAASVRRLERQAGQPLLHRGGVTGIEPTEGGRVLLEYARRLLAAQDETVSAIAQLPVPATSHADHDIAAILRDAESSSVYDLARVTALDRAALLSDRLGRNVLLKREDTQPGFSFKIRGAYHCVSRLAESERARGIVTASAGNHAQGVARAAQHLGLDASIVMPRATPRIKVDAVSRLGAHVELAGRDFEEAYARARQICDETSATFIHPFDDLQVIAGQATVGLELARQMPQGSACVFVPVGGGGLIAGVGAVLKQLRPGIRIIGVEPAGAAGLSRSRQAGEPVRLEHVDTFAEGVAVRQMGRQTFAIAARVVDEVVEVTDDEICAAIRDAYEDCRVMLEPSGAVSVAGLIKHAGALPPGGHAIAILSGANLDFERLPLVAQRGLGR